MLGGSSIPKIYNRKRNICWQLDLLFNEYIDVVNGRPDNECWIPFDFFLDVEGCKFKFLENGTCLTIWEIRKIITAFKDIVSIMRNNSKRDAFKERFKPFEHTCYEVFFDIKVSDADDEILEIELWINMAYLKRSGYKTGFRFDVKLDDFEGFTKHLSSDFESIISKVEH